MKEIIVVDNKAFLNKTDFVCIEDIVKDLKVEYKIEQVPENFSELKELCKGIKEVTITEEGHINVDLVYFTKDGEIYTYVEGVLTSSIFLPVSKDKTPAQMWNIIKNLIGE